MEELIKKAKNLGFESVIVSSIPWKYSNREGLRKMIWLTQLKMFILDTWKTHISIRYRCDGTFEFWLSYVLDGEFKEDDSRCSYYTELEALQAACEYFLGNIES
jgi:hypothetical protein